MSNDYLTISIRKENGYKKYNFLLCRIKAIIITNNNTLYYHLTDGTHLGPLTNIEWKNGSSEMLRRRGIKVFDSLHPYG